MHFHMTRRQLQLDIASRYRFGDLDAQKILDYLEAGSRISFSGGMFIICEPYSQDAIPIKELARECMGQAPGGAVGSYKVKEFLDLTLRNAQQYAPLRGPSAR